MISRRLRFPAFVFVSTMLASSPFLVGQEEGSETREPSFHFETGQPPWRGERILLPPGFAPKLGWKGIEEIRFAPGMFRAGDPDFFSYVIVFLLDPGSDVSESGLERELLAYYRGLSQAVMAGKQRTVVTDGFSLELENVEASPNLAPAAAADAVAWKATLDWVEPFATQKNQTLHFEIHTWKHQDRPVVLSCVSPAEPSQAEPWETLRAIRSKFRLE